MRLIFMLLIAMVIAVSMKIVGVLLITSMMIIPAAAARRFSQTPEQMAVIAAVIGSLAVLLGLAGSWQWDTPAGPSVVVAAASIFALTQIFRPAA
jgi:zinc transport system permease protein